MSLLRLAVLIGIACVGTYGVFCASIYLFQRELLYFPSHLDVGGKGQAPFVPWRRGTGFLGYVSTARDPKEVVLVFHGNAGEALNRTWIREAVPASTIVVLVEYPGYGARPGTPTETSLYTAAEEAFDAAREQWKLPIVLVGESLGTGVVTYLASVRTPDRLALISPYSTMADVAAIHYPWLPVRWLIQDRYDSMHHLTKTKVPLSIIHGDKDDLVPMSLGRRLFDGYAGPTKSFVVVPGAGHNDLAFPLVGSLTAAPFRDFLRNAKAQ